MLNQKNSVVSLEDESNFLENLRKIGGRADALQMSIEELDIDCCKVLNALQEDKGDANIAQQAQDLYELLSEAMHISENLEYSIYYLSLDVENKNKSLVS